MFDLLCSSRVLALELLHSDELGTIPGRENQPIHTQRVELVRTRFHGVHDCQLVGVFRIRLVRREQ